MWSNIAEQVFSLTMIALILRATTPILLAALGGLISDITRVRVVYAATRDDSIIKKENAFYSAVEADDQHTLFFEIYNRF